MENRRRLTRRFCAAGCAVLLICATLTPDTRAYASRRHHPPGPGHHHLQRSHIRSIVPLGVALLTIAGCHYYYHKGLYYRSLQDQYIVTTPPAGAVVVEMPPGHVTFWRGGVKYYYYGKVYYTRGPSGFIVVDPPYETAVPAATAGYQSVSPILGQASVMPPLLNVRSGPGAEHAVTSQVPQGAILEIHGTAPDWVFVKLPSGEFGWVMEKFIFSQPASKQASAEG